MVFLLLDTITSSRGMYLEHARWPPQGLLSARQQEWWTPLPVAGLSNLVNHYSAGTARSLALDQLVSRIQLGVRSIEQRRRGRDANTMTGPPIHIFAGTVGRPFRDFVPLKIPRLSRTQMGFAHRKKKPL